MIIIKSIYRCLENTCPDLCEVAIPVVAIVLPAASSARDCVCYMGPLKEKNVALFTTPQSSEAGQDAQTMWDLISVFEESVKRRGKKMETPMFTCKGMVLAMR